MFWFGSKRKRHTNREVARIEVEAIKKKLVDEAHETTKAVHKVNKFLDEEDVALTLYIAGGGKEKEE